MNMVAQVGGLVGSVMYGYIVTRSGSYDAPFIPMAVVLCIGAGLWLKVDASEKHRRRDAHTYLRPPGRASAARAM